MRRGGQTGSGVFSSLNLCPSLPPFFPVLGRVSRGFISY